MSQTQPSIQQLNQQIMQLDLQVKQLTCQLDQKQRDIASQEEQIKQLTEKQIPSEQNTKFEFENYELRQSAIKKARDTLLHTTNVFSLREYQLVLKVEEMRQGQNIGCANQQLQQLLSKNPELEIELRLLNIVDKKEESVIDVSVAAAVQFIASATSYYEQAFGPRYSALMANVWGNVGAMKKQVETVEFATLVLEGYIIQQKYPITSKQISNFVRKYGYEVCLDFTRQNVKLVGLLWKRTYALLSGAIWSQGLRVAHRPLAGEVCGYPDGPFDVEAKLSWAQWVVAAVQ